VSGAPGVSVVVPVYNAAATLPPLLRSLGAQLPHSLGDTEFLIVDNGSTDDSLELLERSDLANLMVLREAKRGPAAARNRGLAVARGEVLALLDADCVPTRGWLRALVEPFMDSSVVLVAGGSASYPPRTGAQRFAARYGLNEAQRAVYNPMIPFANTRNMAVRRAAALEVGGWPEELTHGEDVEFSYALRKRLGCTIEFRPDALVFHQDRESDEDLVRQAYSYGRGTAVLYRRHADEVAWTLGQRVHRLRRSTQRRLSARLADVGRRLGRVSTADAEFAAYLVLWDRSFWRGFVDGRRELRDA
jgi:glycosyltransferase involved in cell wall biosynthesis